MCIRDSVNLMLNPDNTLRLYSTRVNFRCNKTRNRFILFTVYRQYRRTRWSTSRHAGIALFTNRAARLWLSQLSRRRRRRRRLAFCLSVSLRYHSDSKLSAVVPRRHDTGNGQSRTRTEVVGPYAYRRYVQSDAASIIYKQNVTILNEGWKTNTVKRRNVHAGFKFSIEVAFYHR